MNEMDGMLFRDERVAGLNQDAWRAWGRSQPTGSMQEGSSLVALFTSGLTR